MGLTVMESFELLSVHVLNHILGVMSPSALFGCVCILVCFCETF